MADKKVFMVPGQGAQYVGMRSRMGVLSESASEAFSRADEIVELPLSDIIDRGPESELVRTSVTQPALLAMARACSLLLEERGYAADIVMGHSLGEYAALVYAGVIDYEQALRIVRKRGLLMEGAAASAPGKMAAVIGSDRSELESLVKECSSRGVLEITNYNSPQQVVLSGEKAAVDHAINEINTGNIGKALELNVSAPFHSSLMKPVAEDFRGFLAGFSFNVPHVMFIDNVTGSPESDPERIRDKLVQQLFMPVQWEHSVLAAQQAGAVSFIECGPGSVLSGLVKRTVRGVEIRTGEKILAG